MADQKTSELAALSGADTADGDLYPVVDISAGATKNQTLVEKRVALFKSEYIQLPGALEAAGGFVVNEAGQGKTFYSSHGLASIGEGAFTYVNFDYAALTHTFKTGTAGDVDALVVAADGSANFPVGASVDGDDVITDGNIASALAALGVPQTASVTLTAAQLAALETTPITVVAAPGANKIIWVVGWAIRVNLNGGTSPQNGATAIAPYWGGTAQAFPAVATSDLFPVGSDYFFVPYPGQSTNSASVANSANKEISILANDDMDVADVLTNPMTVTFQIAYTVMAAP